MSAQSDSAKPKPKPKPRPGEAAEAHVGEAISKKPERFPIIGIGASAGGLEALEAFLSNVPDKSRLAIVIVQHLDPTQKGMLVELLQRSTPMRVVQVVDRVRVKPGYVYVIPPNTDLALLHGVLRLFAPAQPRGLRHPIDFFFRSLAQDQQEFGIGVILSGMGSDGTLGLRAIKEHAGVGFVQDPGSAKFAGMPSSAIEGGLADVIAPAEALPGKIDEYLKHSTLITESGGAAKDQTPSGLDKVMLILRSATGNDFSMYRKSTLYRRIEKRMGLHQIDKLAAYVVFLQQNEQEVDLLFHDLLIGVTNFFRDEDAWAQLAEDILPKLLTNRGFDSPVRAWIPGCATGEEAFSLAIVFREAVERLELSNFVTLQVFATDLDSDAIIKARQALYPTGIAADVSEQRLSRFFVPTDGGYQVAKVIRDMVIFAQHNMIMDPPFTKLDLVSCRNVLICLEPEMQKRILPLFHYSLNPGGFLFLGESETAGAATNLFSPLEGTHRLYQRCEPGLLDAEPVDFPAVFTRPRVPMKPRDPGVVVDLQSLVDGLLLQSFSPAAVLTNKKGDILYVSGRTGKYLEPAAGKANWNLFAMAHDALRHDVERGFRQSIRSKAEVVLKRLSIDKGAGRAVTITISPLRKPAPLEGAVLVVFDDVEVPAVKMRGTEPAADSPVGARVEELERACEQSRQETLTVRSEMQSSQEELKSNNEELQSMNEEMHATNEELTTSKEEMQSLNEELQTIKQELRAKLDELANVSNDMKNLLDSTDVATLFLDTELRVRRFTSRTTQLTKLISSDVGRPITDIASALLYAGLADDAREVLRSLIPVEREVSTEDGRWYAARIVPYRTLDNIIDGTVITFSDVSRAKQLESELRRTQVRLEGQLADEIAASDVQSHEREK